MELITVEDAETKSPDLTAANVEQLKSLFPDLRDKESAKIE